LHEPGTAPDVYAAGPIDEGASARYSGLIPQGRNIAAGQTLTYSTGPLIQAEDTAKIQVGSFKIRVP
jgi:hypothetical protein